MVGNRNVFECRQCGICCEGKGGIILSQRDLTRLASFLGENEETVVALYVEKSNGKLKIKCGEDGNCFFFRSGTGCSVHEGKPDICRAWPFFRGNLEDPASLAMAREFCPGIDPGCSFEDFVRSGLAYLRTENLLGEDADKEANSLIINISTRAARS